MAELAVVALAAGGEALATEIAWSIAANYAISGTTFGAIVAAGATAGALLGAAAIAPGLPDVEGPSALNGMQQLSTYGSFIQIPYGRVRTAGNIIWSRGIREEKKTEEVGGKGGGGASVTSYTYFASWGLGLCEGKVKKIHKIWFDSDLVYSNIPTVTLAIEQGIYTLASVNTSTVIATYTTESTLDISVEILNDPDGYYIFGTGADSKKIFLTAAGVAKYNELAKTNTIEMPAINVNFTADGSSTELIVKFGGKTWAENSGITPPSFSDTDTVLNYSRIPGYTNVQTASNTTSSIADFDEKLKIYYGDEEQLPDPLIEAAEGVGSTPAYRGLCYLVFDDIPIGDWGNRIPNITVELSRFPESGSTTKIYPLEIDVDSYIPTCLFYDAEINDVYVSYQTQPDALSLSSSLQSVLIRDLKKTYTIPNENLELQSTLTSVQLRTVLKSYTTAPDLLSLSSDLTSVSLKQSLYTTTMATDSLQLSSTLQSIVLA